MRNWEAFVRDRLTLPELTRERESRVVRELGAQLEDFYEEAIATGMTESEADAHARAQITDWNAIARDVRHADPSYMEPGISRLANALDVTPDPAGRARQALAHLLQDVRFALRQLRRSPTFGLVAVVTLTIGIGATSAIFSVVNGVLLRPLPYPHPDRLVRVHETIPKYGRFAVAPATFLDWRDRSQSFDHLTAYSNGSGTFQWSDGPERVTGAFVSWDLFPMLEVPPSLGGGFVEEQDRPGGNNVIVISHRLWERRFGGDPSAIGRAVAVDGTPATIVGVMPADFYFPTRSAEFWRPIALNPATASRNGHYLGVVGRLKAGTGIDRAAAEMRGLSERLAIEYPQASAGESAEVVDLLEQSVGGIRPALLTLLVAVGVVVLIACANVANLLLVRASVREKEVAIRIAVGAGRRRLVVQMLTESLVLSVIAGACGLLLAYLTIPVIASLSAGGIPRVEDVSIDATVLAFTCAAVVLTGVTFGMIPAWELSSGGTSTALKQGGRSSTGGGGRRMGKALLVGEIALSFVLVVGAALLLRSFVKLTTVDPGFRAENVLAFRVALPADSYPSPEKQVAFFDTLLERLKAVPSVQSVSSVQTLPMGGDFVLGFVVTGQPPRRPGDETSAQYRSITPGYFQTLGISLRRGRAFSTQDRLPGPPVAIVDEAFAARYFPDRDPIGERIVLGNSPAPSEIVGVVSNVSYTGLEAGQPPTMYSPEAQNPNNDLWVLVRADREPGHLAGTARQLVRDIDPTLPAYSIDLLSSTVTGSIAQQRFSMVLILMFGGVALFLAAVGLYGVVAYTVSLRQREIGLRVAIGAQPRDVLTMIVGGGMKLAGLGVVVGMGGALALSQLMKSMLFDVTPTDPLSFVLTSLLLLAVTALACYLPARRAMRIDPMVTLQET